VAWHGRVLKTHRKAVRGIAYFERGLDRLSGAWPGVGAEGERYRDATHPYADDLDLFGRGSLFQRLWQGATRLGEDRLAAWLLTPADHDTVQARQAAVEELRERYDLREAIGLLDSSESDGNQNLLRAWAGVPSRPISSAVRGVAVLLSLTFWSGLLAWSLDAAPVSWPVAAYAACLMLTFVMRGRITEAVGRLDRAEAGLSKLSDVLHIAEVETFRSPFLSDVQSRLKTEAVPCSKRIAELHRLSHRFDAALFNQFFAPIAITFGMPIHLAHAAEVWRERFGSAVPRWLDAAGDFEAILSLAGYAAEHPHDPWPEITTDGALFVATRLGHPLLPESQCVRNDVSLGEPIRLLVVSGSNMAGKSTFLRSVGLNAVLAFAGAPVRATSLRLSPLQLGSVIRVSDSLQSGKSLFFAAIERLKRVAGFAGQQPPLLFLLDELLAGTNSHDRLIGADAILRRLLDDGAIGIVTTHDLALTEIADELSPVAANVHFRDVLVGNTMQFDYTLRPGVVDRGNALALMRLVGLMPVEELRVER
ncbi:MAG: DNA mismatch repair protein MutS, partial [Planctomycetota bacterium]|nr:DNA mismatch repair protein MutS [Planctomycetota bacterium]